MRVFLRLIRDNKSIAYLLVPAIIYSTLFSLFSAFLPYLAGISIDNISSRNFVGLRVTLLIILGCSIVTAILKLLSARVNNLISYSLANNLRLMSYSKVSRLPIRTVDSKGQGDMQSYIVNDTEVVSDGILLFLNQFFSGIATIVIVFILLLSIDWKISAILLLVMPVSLYVSYMIQKKTSGSFKKQSQIRSDMSNFISETISCNKEIRSFNGTKESIDLFEKASNQYRDVSRKAVFYSSIGNPTSRVINSIVFAIVVFFGANQVVSGIITIGALTSLLAYATQFMKPYNELANVFTEISDAKASLSRIYSLIDEEEMPYESNDFTPSTTSSAPQIEFKNVVFSYTKGRPVINDVSFIVPKASRLAIVGPTGCGKTTLINLLLRFYEPDSGTIYIDGQDISTLSREEVRSRIGVVFQDTWFNDASVRENIAYGKPNATNQEVEEASKACHSYGFISRLPNGFEERHLNTNQVFSEGEKQLLSLTRAMVCERSALILDEATSSIDVLSETKVQNAIKKVMVGKTSIVIAHRLSTIEDCDNILVLEKGRLMGQGTHSELLELNGKYSQLYKCYNN